MCKIPVYIILWTICSFTYHCDGILHRPEDDKYVLKKGVLDLSDFRFRENSVAELKGEWEFYYNHFYYPSFKGEREFTGFLNVPESWQGFEIKGEELPRSGQATLRGFLKFNKDSIGQELRIYIPDVASSYRMFAQGILIGGEGKPGTNPEEDSPRLKAKYYTLIPTTEIVEIVFHISNYDNNFPGFWDVPIIGHKHAIDRRRMVTNSRELFLLGALLIIGFYHCGLYFYRRKEKSILYFALFCFCLGVRVAFTGNRFALELFPELSWSLAFRIEFLSYYLAIPIFILFISHLFPLDVNKKVIKSFLIISFLFTFTLLLPVSVFTLLLYGFQAVTLGTILYVIHVNIKAILNRRPNSKLFLLGLISLALVVTVDIIRNALKDQGESFTPYSLLTFAFFQSLILSSRIASSFTQTEELAESLKISNESLVALTENLEVMVLDRTSQLNTTLQRLRKDIQLAKKIQQKILPAHDLNIPRLKLSLFFQPQDEVGGDFYDFFELEDGTIRIFLADATGHGIQAALYTMAIKSEYEALKRFVTKTDDLMSHLNQKIQNKFAGLKIIFSCFVLDIDTTENRLYYTSAGHPDQILLSKRDGLQLLRRTGNIIGLRKEQTYTQISAKIEPGDRIFLFTDGIIEQKNLKREEFGMERIIRKMKVYDQQDASLFIKEMIADLTLFQESSPQEDDQTLLFIECL